MKWELYFKYMPIAGIFLIIIANGKKSKQNVEGAESSEDEGREEKRGNGLSSS